MLPTGLTYSSFAKRSIPFIANCTCAWVVGYFGAIPNPWRDARSRSDRKEPKACLSLLATSPCRVRRIWNLIEKSRRYGCHLPVHVLSFLLVLREISGSELIHIA